MASRREAISRIIGYGSAIPLIGLMINGILKDRDYYSVDPSKAAFIERYPIVDNFSSMQKGFKSSLSRLCDAYRDEYYKSHIEMTTSVDADGNLDTKSNIVWEWEEPGNVPKHRTIMPWKDFQDSIDKKASYLLSKPIIDGSKVKDLEVEKKSISKWGKSIATVAVCGGEIALILCYDKCLSFSTEKEVSRRGFIKFGAAAVAAGAAYGMSKFNTKRSEKGKDKLENEIKSIADLANVSDSEAFRRHFGISHGEIMSHVKDCVNTSKKTLNTKVEESSVRQAFEDVVYQGEAYSEKLQKMFKNGVPEDLAIFANYGHITQELESSSSSEGINAGLNIGLEGLVGAGAIAAVLVPAELLNARMG
ncbi:MAG: twin-arginine translocation signal domain-containing protein [Candidatus Woesearchaeota archaeon]